MPGVSGAPKHYFVEKDRVASFKSWPFTERHDCSITKVGCMLYFYYDLFIFKRILLKNTKHEIQ